VTGGIVAKRLPSGAALVIRPGAFCHTRKRVKREGYDGYYYNNNIDYFHEGMWKPQPVTDAPLMLWLDDAENPTQIEAYVSLDYYEHPNARVKLHGFTRQAKRSGSVTDVRDEVPWLAKGNSFWSGLEDAEKWIGHFYWAVPESIWREDAVFSRFADVQVRSSFVQWRDDLMEEDTPIDFRDGTVVPVFRANGIANLGVGDSAPKGLVPLYRSSDEARGGAHCRGRLSGGGGHPLAWLVDEFRIDDAPIQPLPENSPELKYSQWANLIFDEKSGSLLFIAGTCVNSNSLFLR